MKKGVVAISAILLVAAGIVLPAGYFGQVAEQTLKSRIANMPYGLQMEVAEYKRGWFSSTARLEWQPPGNLATPPVPGQGPLGGVPATGLSTVFVALDSGPIAIDLEIAHGPVFFAVGPGVGLFNARGRIDAGGWATEAAREPGEGGGNFMDVYVSSFSGGTVSSRLEFETLDWYIGPVAVNLSGGRMAGEWTGSNAFQLQHAALEKIDLHTGMAGAGVRISVSDIESRAQYPQGLESGVVLAPVESNASVGEARVAASGGNTLMRMTGLSALSSAGVDADGLYRLANQLKIESLEVMERAFAPVELNQESGGFSEAAMLKLVAAASAGIIEAPPDAQSPEEQPPEPAAGPPGGTLAAALPPLTADMKEAIRAMLADGPYGDVSTVAMYQGEHAVKLDMSHVFDPDRVPAGVEMASLPAVVSSLEYTLDLEVARVAAEELFGQGLLQRVLTQRLLEQNETTYSLSVALRNGTIELNGRTLPLSFPTAPASPFNEDAPSRFTEDAPFRLGDDEPSPFDQARPPPSG